ncbi:hypothetical protein Rsub_04375 [Raphidocelis subcapitata]|uniref:GDT1 family protein n=1 Tax=Raphidocelis subcapitata TaxID=307507 RepID=A0A2V0NWL0_9CHLO|nr:hypothetical protein Rsub_04375 [Raphidocelis subcapitata]|eukprot:GBF92028.1 hypothetical protein Rsub_04375 [Raphidocelis subcapitata]
MPAAAAGAAVAAAAGADAHRRFLEALGKAIGVIGASEIGDKTFFIAAIMAMRHARLTVFGGALAALAVMTVLAVALGWAAPALIPKTWTHYAATALFFFFGFKTLWDAYNHDGEGESELEAVEQELADGRGSRDRLASYKDRERDAEAGGGGDTKGKPQNGGAARVAAALACLVSPVFINAFVLTFLAEWGDRSQIATIGLAASSDVVGVTVGSIIGHAACTAAAVIGGRHLAAHIDERTVGYVGGVVFVLFGLHSLWEGPQ